MKTHVTTVVIAALFASGCAVAGDFLGAPAAKERPWDVLKNTMTTTQMQLAAVRADKAPAIDGKADDAAWKDAFSVSTFGKIDFKGYSDRKNAVRFLFDDKNLYIACTGEISSWQDWLASNRDHDAGAWEDESFEIFIDPGRTQKDYYHFIVNAVGSTQEGKGWDDRNYNPKYEAKAGHDDKSYTVEVAIPWEALDLKAAPKDGDVWGINVCRNDKELKETSSVRPVNNTFHDAKSFAEIQFGPAPQVYLDNFSFDQIVKGDNVLKFRAYGKAVEGTKALLFVAHPEDMVEVPLNSKGVTELPFKLNVSGTTKLMLVLVKDDKKLNTYEFEVMLYEDRLVLPVTGGPDFYEGTPSIDLRLDVRLPEQLLAGKSVKVALKQGGMVLRGGAVSKLPGSYLAMPMDISKLPIGHYELQVLLINNGMLMQETTQPLNIIKSPYLGAPAAAGNTVMNEAPELFASVWGKIGPDVHWRIADANETAGMKLQGKTDEYAKAYYDLRTWPEKQIASEKPATAFTGAQKQQGYVLFARHYAKRVFDYTVPETGELLDQARGLQAFAAQGQYEPMTFAIHALKDQSGVKVELSDLKSGSVTLGKENLDVRVVRSYPKNASSPWWDNEDPATKLPLKQVIPLALEKLDSFDVPAGRTKQVWITVKAPDNCPPGLYTGTATVAVGGKSRQVPLTLRVLPFALVKLDKAAFLYSVRHEKNAFIDYREHGFNVVDMGLCLSPKANDAVRKAFDQYMSSKDPKFQVPLPPTDEIFAANKPQIDNVGKLAKETKLEVRKVYFTPATWFISGWSNVINWEKYFPTNPELDQKYVDAVNAIITYTQQQGLPEFVIVPGDEPGGHPETLPDIQHYLKLTKDRIKHARTAMDVGGGLAMKIDEIGQLNEGSDLFITNYLNADLLARFRQTGKELWLYNTGSGTSRDPQRDRQAYGFFAWKIGATGMAQWVYCGGRNPVEFMGYGMGGDNWAYVFPSADVSVDPVTKPPEPPKPLPTIHYEAFRAGLDDQRYGATLAKLIEAADASGDAKAKAAAAQARETIAHVLAPFKLNFMDRILPADVLRQFDELSIDPQALDTLRWEIANEIMNLQQVLGDKGKIDPAAKGVPLVVEEK